MNTPSRRSSGLLLVLAATVGLGACSHGAESHAAGSSSTAVGAATKGADPTAARLAAARRDLAMYDYAGARSALSGQTSPQAATLRRQVDTAAHGARTFRPDSQISHLFYHSLVVDPKRAFSPHMDAKKRQGYLDYMVTEKEFRAQLEQIYRKGYVLVHPERIAATDAKGTMTYRPITLPAGKKPLVLSVDDVSYYTYMNGDGFASNLMLDGSGRVRNTYVDAAGHSHIGAYDVSTVIDDFVARHPDFSYHGDKGTIALTGYNGVLGYRSSFREYGHTPATEAARRKATAVATAMKRSGWNFASHSYGHINFTKDSLPTIQRDTDHWFSEVEPIIGSTPEMIYPFGNDIAGTEPYTPANAKYAYLYRRGFRYFANIRWDRPFWEQMNGRTFRQARIDVDGITMGYTLAGRRTALPNFFDTRTVVDPARQAAQGGHAG